MRWRFRSPSSSVIWLVISGIELDFVRPLSACRNFPFLVQKLNFLMRDDGCSDLDLHILHGQENTTGDAIPSIYKHTLLNCYQMLATYNKTMSQLGSQIMWIVRKTPVYIAQIPDYCWKNRKQTNKQTVLRKKNRKEKKIYKNDHDNYLRWTASQESFLQKLQHR